MPTEKKRILVVDDDPVVRESFSRFLGKDAYSLFSANDGQRAIEIAVTSKPELVFLDVIMPKMDGFEVLKKLRKMRPTKKIPIIMVTAKSDSATIIRSLEMGANDFIAKPFLKIDLITKIKFALSKALQQKKIVEETLIPDKSAYTDGPSFEEMKNRFILNFEHVYINLLKLVSSQNQIEIDIMAVKLTASFEFYKFYNLEKYIELLRISVRKYDWENVTEALEKVYNHFKHLRQVLPKSIQS